MSLLPVIGPIVRGLEPKPENPPMPLETPPDGLPALTYLQQLSAAGVKRLETTEWTVEFFPATPPAQVTALRDDELPCPCGHATAEHNNDGLCLRGCGADTCTKPTP